MLYVVLLWFYISFSFSLSLICRAFLYWRSFDKNVYISLSAGFENVYPRYKCATGGPLSKSSGKFFSPFYGCKHPLAPLLLVFCLNSECVSVCNHIMLKCHPSVPSSLFYCAISLNPDRSIVPLHWTYQAQCYIFSEISPNVFNLASCRWSRL